MNGDGKTDLVIGYATGGCVSVMFGNGNGTFGPKTQYAVGSNPVAVAVADVNGDGIPDIITANNADNTVSILNWLWRWFLSSRD